MLLSTRRFKDSFQEAPLPSMSILSSFGFKAPLALEPGSKGAREWGAGFGSRGSPLPSLGDKNWGPVLLWTSANARMFRWWV